MQVRFACDRDEMNITHKCNPLPYNSNDNKKPYRCGYWDSRALGEADIRAAMWVERPPALLSAAALPSSACGPRHSSLWNSLHAAGHRG
jgi:hypothetical protein